VRRRSTHNIQTLIHTLTTKYLLRKTALIHRILDSIFPMAYSMIRACYYTVSCAIQSIRRTLYCPSPEKTWRMSTSVIVGHLKFDWFQFTVKPSRTVTSTSTYGLTLALSLLDARSHARPFETRACMQQVDDKRLDHKEVATSPRSKRTTYRRRT
jgi:hypothetical protein